jgi:peptidyl-tRNA hydrolase
MDHLCDSDFYFYKKNSDNSLSQTHTKVVAKIWKTKELLKAQPSYKHSSIMEKLT